MAASRSPFDVVRVTAVRHVRDHVLWLEFSDGVAGELDLANHLVGAMFEPLRAREEFARVRLHALCGEDSIAVEIDGDGIRGSFQPNRLPLLFEWRELHRAELRANWERLRRGESPLPIEPLD